MIASRLKWNIIKLSYLHLHSIVCITIILLASQRSSQSLFSNALLSPLRRQSLHPLSSYTNTHPSHSQRLTLVHTMTKNTYKKKQSESYTGSGVAIHWFRNGLRFHDNPPLRDAVTNPAHTSLLPLYIIDPDAPFAQTEGRKAGILRANFILESLVDLDEKFRQLFSSRLIVLVGKPKDILPLLIDRLNADALYYEKEPAAPIRQADAQVLECISSTAEDGQDCIVHGYDTHTLHPVEHYVALCKHSVAPSSYGKFRQLFDRLGPVPSEVKCISEIPSSDFPPLPSNLTTVLEQLNLKSTGIHENVDKKSIGEIPTLDQLGYTPISTSKSSPSQLTTRTKGGLPFQGGETTALSLLQTQTKRTKWIATFQKPQTKPNALTVDTTGLSPYIKHGCISPRTFYHALDKVYAAAAEVLPANVKLSQPPVSLHGQLLWREYNYLMGYTTPNFDVMVGNPIARQIPWSGVEEEEDGEDGAKVFLEAWTEGKTGYPYIDAIMVQLRETGWIHHLARHSVACFLTRGDLWISWEEGAKVFEERLLDADWSINNFNWQWLSCTAHFYQYFRCYSPIAFGKKTDKNGDYIRKWLPQFQHFPTKYIYEPWTAPMHIQVKAGVVIGKDYPHPIVDHKVVSRENMGKMKEAYDAAKSLDSDQGQGQGQGGQGQRRENEENGGESRSRSRSKVSFSSSSSSSLKQTKLTDSVTSGARKRARITKK